VIAKAHHTLLGIFKNLYETLKKFSFSVECLHFATSQPVPPEVLASPPDQHTMYVISTFFQYFFLVDQNGKEELN